MKMKKWMMVLLVAVLGTFGFANRDFLVQLVQSFDAKMVVTYEKDPGFASSAADMLNAYLIINNIPRVCQPENVVVGVSSLLSVSDAKKLHTAFKSVALNEGETWPSKDMNYFILAFYSTKTKVAYMFVIPETSENIWAVKNGGKLDLVLVLCQTTQGSF